MSEIYEKFQEFLAREWVVDYIIPIFLAIVILVVGRLVAKAATGIIRRTMIKRNVDKTITTFVCNLGYIFLMVFVVLAALAKLGIQTTSFVAIIGAAGLAIGLALQGSLSNFAAGFLMIIFRPFKVDDYIMGAGVEGLVEEIQVFTTVLKTLDNKTVIIPNAKLTGDNIINYSAKQIRRVDLVFGVAYNADIQSVRSILQSVADADNRILKDPAVQISVGELADSSVNFVFRPWVNTADYWDVYFDTIEAVKKSFDAEGIGIPFPQRDVHLFQAQA